MEQLQHELDMLISKLPDEASFRNTLSGLQSVYPFNEYEYIIAHLLTEKIIGIDGYYDMRDRYIHRNLYLYVFELSPRGLGDKWAMGQLKQLAPELQRPNKKLHSDYAGEYDFWLPWIDTNGVSHGIRIEVKSSRAVDYRRPDEPMSLKALASGSLRLFDMNFQQMKPLLCDVFLWIAVCGTCQ